MPPVSEKTAWDFLPEGWACAKFPGTGHVHFSWDTTNARVVRFTEGDGTLRSEWAALLAEYPDRLLVGFDLFVPAHYRLPYVRDTVGYYRGLLGQLDVAAAEQIAFRNAERLAPLGPVESP